MKFTHDYTIAPKKKKRKKKKIDRWEIPKERCLPVIISECCGEKTVWTGTLLYWHIYEDYCRSQKWRDYLDASLPLDYLAKIQEEYKRAIKNNSHPERYISSRTDDKYKNYIASPEWQALRKRIIAERKVCEICGSEKMLQVHHKTYENFEHEKDEDLQLLCHECHCKVHGRIF